MSGPSSRLQAQVERDALKMQTHPLCGSVSIPPDNRSFFITILSAQREGRTCLPARMGLSASDFHELLQCLPPEVTGVSRFHVCSEDDLRQELLDLRRDEWEDLRDLLMAHRSHQCATETWMVDVVAAGCLGGDHLWRDLGLKHRAELRDLLMQNFAPLAMRNTQDMKWKRFFYKQLCDQEGSYVCRAPSCEQCVAYDDCFGRED